MPSFEIDYEEDLVPRIRDLINGYDKDSILKEYLQNADDSGATEVIVTFDKQKYPNLNNTEYELAGGTSLLIYNNSLFREKDFENIVKISNQGKENDANSTGRFGQGFSSSFSISDQPSFVSNGRAYWFDVLRTSVSADKSRSIQGWEQNDFKEIEQWIQTFELVGYKNNFKGTIFRLPLRNEITASESRISDEIFSFDDFLKWVDEWKKHPDNILFLRHIHKLTLQEVNESGVKKIHLEIKTKNIKEIEQINDSIQSEFKESLIDTCVEWKSSNKDLPLFTYKHALEVNYLNREESLHIVENRRWSVVNGLFRGVNDCLINQAIKVLKIKPQKRKVLPWAGVAIEIDKNNLPIQQKYKYFTFLPLPIKSNYPAHIHGWFDINSKRTEIISSGSGYNLETVVEWNELLLEEGVGKAWAMLIDSLKNKQKNYYSFWAKETEFDLNDNLIEGFYKHISKLDCLYTVSGSKKLWKSPAEESLNYFRDEKNSVLVDAFKEEFPLILSRPNKHILDNFENIDIEIKEITPGSIREFLLDESKDIQFPTTLKDMDISFLRKKKWFLEVLKYCADSEEDYTLIDGLPLEMTLNKEIYKVEANTFFTKTPDLKLFQDFKFLFLDTEIVDLIGETDTLPDSWLEPTFINKIRLLTEYWEKLKLSKEWLSEFVTLISSSNEDEYDEAKSIIKKLEGIYQENGEYATLNSDINNFSPFMARKEDLKNNIKYYKIIEMNIVHHEYIDVYAPLLKYDGIITEVSSYTLIQHLLLLDDFSFFEDIDTTEFILSILTENLSWFDTLTPYEKDVLYSMPFIRTANEGIYSKNTAKKLFLPTNFSPPDHIKSLEGEYELIAVEGDTNLYELYKKMDIEEQNISNYIQEIIIPFLENSDDLVAKRDVLAWLIEGWSSFRDDISDSLLNRLKSARIIPMFDDETKSYKAHDVYLPNIELPEFLKDNSYFPLVFKDKDIQKYWHSFLEELGASNIILVQHVISTVEKIIEMDDKKGSVTLLNYIANNFELFENMYYKNQALLNVLKEYAWLPVEYPNGILQPIETYTNLRYAKELILLDDLKLVGGVYYVLDTDVKLGKKDELIDYSSKDMARLLGIVVDLPDESVFTSFRELQKYSPKSGQVLNYAKEFYKYLGRKHFNSIPFTSEDKTILVKEEWVAPKYVYQGIPNLKDIYSWSYLVKDNIDSTLAKGLILLGVQPKPTIEFYVEYLEGLPQEKKLETHQLQDAKTLLSIIQKDGDNLFSQYDILPILTPNNKLVLSTYLYINDLKAYKNAKEKNNDLQFCQTQFDQLAKRLGVLELSKNYEATLFNYIECDSTYEINKILERNSFKEAILRLIYKEQWNKDDQITEEVLYNVLPSKLIFVNELVVDYYIDDIFLFRSDETTHEEEGILYILDQDDEDDMIEIISKYICDAKDLSRDSFACIERILRNKMNKSEIDNFLNKRKIGELPEKFDYDDDIPMCDTRESATEEVIQTGIDTENERLADIGNDIEHDIGTMNKTQNSRGRKSKKKSGNELNKNNLKTSTNVPPITLKDITDLDLDTITSAINTVKDSSNNTTAEELAPPTTPRDSADQESTTNKNVGKSGNGNNKNNNNSVDNNINNKSSSKNIPSSNSRIPVYVGKDNEDYDEEQSKERQRIAKERGDKGEDLILERVDLKLAKDNIIVKAPQNNPGFDLIEKTSSGELVRYIEVKTLSGEWQEGGVSLTPVQLKYAMSQQDKWWLFVVEGLELDNTVVHRLKNPVVEANKFMFDAGWRELAVKPTNMEQNNSTPKIGELYAVTINGNKVQYEITKVKKTKILTKVWAKRKGDTRDKLINLNEQWEKVNG